MSPSVKALLDDVSDSALAEALTARGWHCVRVNTFDWETPLQFNSRHHKSKNWLARQMYYERSLPEFDKRLGKTGRLVRLRSNPLLEDFAANATKQ